MPDPPVDAPRTTAAPTEGHAPEQSAVGRDAGPPVAPTIADGVERPLDPRSIALQRKIGWIVAASISPAVLTGLLLAIFLIPLSAWLAVPLLAGWAAVTAALVFAAQRWPAIEHRHAGYRVDTDGIAIRRGVFWRKLISVPRSRVQHIDVSQGPLERSHGLGTLIIYTAGTEHAKVELHGLDHGVALRIRDHLLPDEGDDAV